MSYSAPIPEDDAVRLATLRSYAILDTLPEQGYDDVTALATFICSTPFSLISFVDKDRQWFKSEVGLGASQTSRDAGFCSRAIFQPETFIVEDTHLDDRFRDNPLVLGQPGIRFYAGAPIVAPNGHILGTVCVFDDKPRQITPSQVAALEALSRQVMSLLEARQKLAENEKTFAALIQSEKIAAVGRLASSMSHEINNPLEAVTNLLYLARHSSSDPEVVSWLEQADRELRRVGMIANQTLRFHKQASYPTRIACVSLFAATLNLYEARLRNAGIQVDKRRQAEAPVECFEGDLRQVLSNIITNAIDAMPKGGRLIVRSRVATDWRTGHRGLVLTVADTGPGMDPITRQRCFDAFFTTKDIGGLGLGLWISREIMDRHNGAILLRTRAAQGSVTRATGTVVSLFVPFRPAAVQRVTSQPLEPIVTEAFTPAAAV